MQTTDGHEAKNGHHYFLENGQSVILDTCATTEDEMPVFLVIPFYEGETMTVSGDGGSHYEYTAEYEHEGELALVKSIFKVAPLEKLDSRYKNILSQIESLSLFFGEIKKQSNLLSIEKARIEREINVLQKTCEKAKENYLQAETMLDSTTDLVSKKKNELSELEDSISVHREPGGDTLVSTAELQRLNKRDFKLQCFEAGGIDNWQWYDESLEDYRKRYP